MRRLAFVCWALVVGVAASAGADEVAAPAAHAGEGHAPEPAKKEVGGALRYALPAIGSYELPVITRVGRHQLVGSAGDVVPVVGAAPGSFSVVAFVYRSCADANGCPLMLATLQRLDHALAARPDLQQRVRLVTVSFDPARDDPAAMAELRHHMAPRTGWRFLTARSTQELEPVLEDFGQDAVPRQTRGGADAALFEHVAKVFLVDGEGGVRNIYSAGFLDHRLLLRDIETLAAAP